MTEENPLLDLRTGHGSGYDYSKVNSETLVRENDCTSLSTRIIYPTAVFGPNDFNLSLFGQAIVKMAQGRLPVMVEGGYDWVDARDVAWGAIEAAEKAGDGARFIFSGHYLDVAEVAAVISGLTGVAAPRFTCPLWLARSFAPLMGTWARLLRETPIYTRDSLKTLSGNRNMSHEKAAKQLAYRPRPFRESMQDALTFYQAQNRIQVLLSGMRVGRSSVMPGSNSRLLL